MKNLVNKHIVAKVIKLVSVGSYLPKIIFISLIFFFTATGFCLASEEAISTDSTKSDYLFLGNETLPPMSYTKDGKQRGIVVDLANAIKERMSHDVRIDYMDWAKAQKMVDEGAADALLQINSSEERNKIYDFSNPLLESEFTIFITSGRDDIYDVNSLNGLQVGVEGKGLPIQVLSRYPLIQFVIIPDIISGFHLLTDHKVDAVVVDRWVGTFIVAENNIRGVRIAGESIEKSNSAIAVKKGNSILLDSINRALDDIKKDGTYAQILAKWEPKEIVFQTKSQYFRQKVVLFSLFCVLFTVTLAGAFLIVEVKKRRQFEKQLVIHQHHLESIVKERTAGLEKSNTFLQAEIVERKRGEEALRKSENRFRDVVNSIGDWIWEIDKKGNYTYISDTVTNTLGYSTGEMIGKTPFEFMPENERDKFKEIFLQILAKSEPIVNLENWNLTKNGAAVCFLTNGVPILDSNGELLGYRGVDKNITNQKQLVAEKAEIEVRLQQSQKMESIGTLAGGIAHDFNNILSVILGYTEIAKDDCQPGSSISKYLDEVLGASNRAKGLVQQILTFSRQDDTERITLQPASIVKETLRMLRPSLPTTIDITQDINTETRLVFVDPSQLSQIVMNLCTNAFHAMEEIGGKLDISLKEVTLSNEDLIHEPDVKNGTFVQLSIGDSGTGIALAVKDKIFNPYFTTKETGKGTGMGLSMIHGIVKNYGGFISFYSELGEGTTFHVFLPTVEQEALTENEVNAQIPIGRERILFVDDEESLAQMSRAMLERLGYHVTVRNSSLEALETFQNQPDNFDIVITDQTMPAMTGSDLSRRMLQIRSDIPIILCTGYSTIISEEKAKAMGIKGFAFKPVAKKDIATLIRKVLDTS